MIHSQKGIGIQVRGAGQQRLNGSAADQRATFVRPT
jgi:hypothetical protein